MKRLILVFLIILAFSSCTKNKEDFFVELDLPGINVEQKSRVWAVVTDEIVRLRELPSFDSQAISIIHKGSVIEYSDISNNWVYIKYDNLKGWINQKSINLFNTQAEAFNFSKNISSSALNK